jgi:hypothetical protein
MRDSPLPESLSAFHDVVLAHAKADVRSGWAYGPRDARRQSPLRTPLPPKPDFPPHNSCHFVDPMPTKDIWRPFKSHRQITASVANTTDLLQTTLSKLSRHKILPQDTLVAPGQSR